MNNTNFEFIEVAKLRSESVFPYEHENMYGSKQTIPGMSKRFFAACMAMQGLLAAGNGCSELVIKWAYLFADELLKQENEESPDTDNKK